MEIGWTLVGVIVPMFIGAAMSLVGMSPAHFRAARTCFIMAAVLLGGMSLVWESLTSQPLWFRVAVGITVGSLIGVGLPESVRWVSKREHSTRQIQPKTRDAEDKLPLLYLDCNRISLPVLLRPDSPIYNLDANAPNGDFRVNSVTAGEARWPYPTDEGQYGYKCELTNFSDNPVFAISAVFTFSRLETKKADGGSLQSGKVLDSSEHPVSIPKIDPDSGKFIFYVWTSGESFVQLIPPATATLEIPGQSEKVQVGVKQSSGPGSTFLTLTPRISPKPSLVVKPPTLQELFKSDFSNVMKADAPSWSLLNNDARILGGPVKVYLDFIAKTKFISFYIPRSEFSYQAATDLWRQVQPTFTDVEQTSVQMRYHDNVTDIKDLLFSGRVFLYHEDNFTLRQLADLVDIYKVQGMALEFRGPEYLADQLTSWYQEHGAKGAK